MLQHISDNVSNLYLHTGNMLYYTDVTKQVNMLTTEQIIEGLKTSISSFDKLPAPENDSLFLKQAILINQTDEDKKNLQTMIKVFLTSPDTKDLKNALDYSINDLELPSIDSVILSYQSKSSDQSVVLGEFRTLWNILEDFVKSKKVHSIGVSDMETELFKQLHDAAEIKPSINQINLSTCCVVPKDLQDFCKEHDIRILTHNDPPDILPVSELLPLFHTKNGNSETNELKLFSGISVSWVTRFQAHIRCRGILSSKGYIVSLNLK